MKVTRNTTNQQEQSKSIQSKAKQQASHDSILQAYKSKTTQLQSGAEEELVQGKFETVQQVKMDEEELVQGKFETTQLAAEEESLQRQPNNTGLPDNLKSGIENLSGYSMNDVKVHYNSSQPATLQAHAYAQGTDIHVAPGQEKHLPHEAWHVVQQKQGRVKPTKQMKGTVPVNDDTGLEKEADVMGAKALSSSNIQLHTTSTITQQKSHDKALQLKTQILSQQDQQYNFGTGSINVGKFMEVGLDPSDMKQGQSANLNTSQDDMMSAIRSKWGIVGGGLVKGHLWNDNLGGSAMNYNLYPITKAANSDHLGYVENKAKEYVWNKQPIYYRVEVDANPTITDPKADFDCEIRSWDPATGKLGSRLFGPVTIESDLNNVGAYNEAYETYTGNMADRQKRPKKPKWAQSPKTRVGELTKQELKDRQNQ